MGIIDALGVRERVGGAHLSESLLPEVRVCFANLGADFIPPNP